MKKSVTIIGHFGGDEHLNDGQTVKTIALYNELKRATDRDIRIVDTYYKSKHPIRLLVKTLLELLRTQRIIILLSQNGLRFYLPLLYYAAKIRRTKVYHDVIGGNLGGYIEKHPQYVKYLNSFKVNYVETRMLQGELQKKGISNAEILPNFRRFPPLREAELKADFGEPFCFCTFSRVAKEKGIEDAIQAVEKINSEVGRAVCRLNIYGPIGRDYAERFDAVMKNTTEAVQYRGNVPTEQAVNTIKNYYAVLFPTYWLSEGQAGTIIESLTAGVPIIATDWRANHEMIQNGYNGMLYPSEQAKTLTEGIKWIISQKENMLNLKKNCLKSALYYQPDEHIKKMIEFMEK